MEQVPHPLTHPKDVDLEEQKAGYDDAGARRHDHDGGLVTGGVDEAP
jgi:hypothetical protein